MASQLYKSKNLWEGSQLNGFDIINHIYNKEKNAYLFFNSLKEIQQNLDKHRTRNFLGSLLQHKTVQATKYMSKWIEAKNK